MIVYDIVLATYNGEKFIKEQLMSIIKAVDFCEVAKIGSLIISDDGSKDKTLSIIKEEMKKYSFILLFENGFKNGVKENFQNGLEKSNSDYVFLADQDDVWHENKIEISLIELIKLEENNKKIPALILSNVNFVDENLSFISSGHDFLANDTMDPSMTVYRSFGQGCTMGFNKALIQKALPIPSNSVMHDWWMLLVASNFGKVKYISKPLMDYRQHSDNVSGGIKNNSFKRYFNFKRQGEYLQEVSIQSQLFLGRFENLINDTSSLKGHLFLSKLKNKNLIEKLIFYYSGSLKIRGIKNNIKFLIQLIFNG